VILPEKRATLLEKLVSQLEEKSYAIMRGRRALGGAVAAKRLRDEVHIAARDAHGWRRCG
jgi:hypothetical protein